MRLAAALVALVFAAGCGGDDPPKLLTETVGSGPQTATIIRPDVDGRQPVVLFLHGWGEIGRATTGRGSSTSRARETPSSTRATRTRCWSRRRSSATCSPPCGWRCAASTRNRARWSSRATPPAGRSPPTTRGSPAAPASRCRSRCSAPTPAGGCRGCRSGSRVDPARIPADTRLIALAGTRDRVVGMRPARRLARLAGSRHRSLVVVSDPAVSDHLGPQRADAPARRAFWARLDRLIRATRG